MSSRKALGPTADFIECLIGVHMPTELRLAAERCSELATQLQANRDMLIEMATELLALADQMDAKDGPAS